MEFIKEELFDAVLTRYYKTNALTLDTADFVSEKDQKAIDKAISKNRKKRLKQVDILYLITLKDKGIKLGLFDRLRISFSGLEPIYHLEKAEQEKAKKLAERKNLRRKKSK